MASEHKQPYGPRKSKYIAENVVKIRTVSADLSHSEGGESWYRGQLHWHWSIIPILNIKYIFTCHGFCGIMKLDTLYWGNVYLEEAGELGLMQYFEVALSVHYDGNNREKLWNCLSLMFKYQQQ